MRFQCSTASADDNVQKEEISAQGDPPQPHPGSEVSYTASLADQLIALERHKDMSAAEDALNQFLELRWEGALFGAVSAAGDAQLSTAEC